MNCVGIDVSKGKSMIAVMRPFGEVVVSPFEVRHTANELSELAGLLKSLDGETRVVMESTGNYHAPVAWLLHDAGLYVSVVNAMLVHDYGNNSLRRAKTDKKDAVKLANYGLDHWLTLPRYIPEEDTRLMLKICYRQYQQYSKVQTMLKNNLISLLDTTFPDANRLFTSPPRADGSEKWVDFVATFWHCECVCGRSEKAFTTQYQKWCRKHGYNFSEDMIAVMRPFGEVVVSPFEVRHTANELSELAGLLKSLDGETRVVMESTGNYHAPVAWLLHDAGLYVSVVNAMLVHDYGNNSLRRAKTDKKDAVKLANYGLDHWLTLPRYIPEEDTRLMLKICYRQYQQYSKVQTMLKNNLISLLDTTFPDANRLFTSPPRADGSEKWVDFVATFWHCECVCGRSEKAFTTQYQKWCRKHGYNFSEDKALDIYASACRHFGVIPKTDTAKLLVEQAISQLQTTSSALAALKQEMQSLAASLPEYPVVMGMFGVGPTLGPQLLAEIGDVRRFHSKKALVAFAGIDAPPYQSGQIDVRSRSISKRGSASLRRTLFLVMSVILQCAPIDEPVYQFMDKKRSEGKPYRVYMMASANKFLRIYYASVKAYLESLEHD